MVQYRPPELQAQLRDLEPVMGHTALFHWCDDSFGVVSLHGFLQCEYRLQSVDC